MLSLCGGVQTRAEAMCSLALPPLEEVGDGWCLQGIARRSGRQAALRASVDLSALAEAILRSMSWVSTHRFFGMGGARWLQAHPWSSVRVLCDVLREFWPRRGFCRARARRLKLTLARCGRIIAALVVLPLLVAPSPYYLRPTAGRVGRGRIIVNNQHRGHKLPT